MTPTDLAEAVRLARLVDDYATNGTRHTMPGGYVADISRALVAVVAERDALASMTFAVTADGRVVAERNDLADWRQRAERAEAALRELQRDALPSDCQRCGGVGAEPPGCPESGPCERCGGWTTHKRLVAAQAAQAATARARFAEEVAVWHDGEAERLGRRITQCFVKRIYK